MKYEPSYFLSKRHYLSDMKSLRRHPDGGTLTIIDFLGTLHTVRQKRWTTINRFSLPLECTSVRLWINNEDLDLPYIYGHLILSHLGLAFVLMLRPFFPEIVMSTDLLSFEHPSVLLFCSLLDFDDAKTNAMNTDSLRVPPKLVNSTHQTADTYKVMSSEVLVLLNCPLKKRDHSDVDIKELKGIIRTSQISKLLLF